MNAQLRQRRPPPQRRAPPRTNSNLRHARAANRKIQLQRIADPNALAQDIQYFLEESPIPYLHWMVPYTRFMPDHDDKTIAFRVQGGEADMQQLAGLLVPFNSSYLHNEGPFVIAVDWKNFQDQDQALSMSWTNGVIRSSYQTLISEVDALHEDALLQPNAAPEERHMVLVRYPIPYVDVAHLRDTVILHGGGTVITHGDFGRSGDRSNMFTRVHGNKENKSRTGTHCKCKEHDHNLSHLDYYLRMLATATNSPVVTAEKMKTFFESIVGFNFIRDLGWKEV
jgi:hypothetical protein